jgi:O-antigen/teichoic acid export membrane protein
VSTVVLIPLGTLNVIFPPVIAEYYARGEHKQLASMFKTVTRWSFSLSWPIFLCCLVFHDAILGIFGEKYITVGLVLIILSLGLLVDSAVGSVGYLLVMTGRSRIVLTNAVATFIVNIALISLLVPRFTIIGAAIAAALTEIIINIAGLIEIYWIMGIHPYRWDILKPIIAGGVASVGGVLLLRVSPVSYGWLAIFIALGLVLAFMIVYVLVLALLGFSTEDMIVFDAVRAKLGKKKSDRSFG